MAERNGWHVLEFEEGRGGGNEQLETIQASMLEMVMPVLPHRLNESWRKVIESIDILDIPGMRAGRQGAEQGKRQTADTIEEQMEIVKRGKVAYLFERYTEEMLIQTLLLLARGGNLEVTSQMKYHIDKWGRARYGDEVWPKKVRDKLPALFLGITGIDEEFRNRDEFANPMLYNTRLNQLADALGEVMSDFGGENQPFMNVYPIRYPGTWDANRKAQEEEGIEKWNKAGEAFMKSAAVQKFVANPDLKWERAIIDNDGGLSLISEGWREITTAHKKQEQLENSIKEVRGRLLQLAQSWYVNADSNVDREQRKMCAERIVDWLRSNPQAVYDRVQTLQKTLGSTMATNGCCRILRIFPRGLPWAGPRRWRNVLRGSCRNSGMNGPRSRPCRNGRRTPSGTRKAGRGWEPRTSASSPALFGMPCAPARTSTKSTINCRRWST